MTPHQKAYIIQSIDKLYLELETLSSADDKFNCVNNIIELKKLINFDYHKSSLYLDLKIFIKNYILANEDKESHYDEISIDIIKKKITCVEKKLQLNLIKLFKKRLLLDGYLDEASECERIIQNLKFKIFKEEKGVKSFFKFLVLWSSNSITNLLLCLTVFFLVATLFLIDSGVESMRIVDVEIKSYSDNKLLNHLANTITLFFEFDEGMKITANSISGVLFIVFAKIIYILILVNFVAKRLFELIEINE